MAKSSKTTFFNRKQEENPKAMIRDLVF